MMFRYAAVLVVLAPLVGASPAVADTPVVFDNLASPPGSTRMIVEAETVMDLRIDLGSDVSTGVKCDASNDPPGDELCAADMVVTVDGPGSITSFAPAAGIVFDQNSTTELRLNLLQTDNALLGPQDLGTVTVRRDGGQMPENPLKVEVNGQALDAAGTLVTIPTQTIALPEPTGHALLGSGIVGLAFLRWQRTRRELRRRRASRETPAA